MSKMIRLALAGSCLATITGLSACHKSDTAMTNNQAPALPALPSSVPMQAGPPTAMAYAPAAANLPRAPRPTLHRLSGGGAEYAYLDRAAAYDDAMGDAPPDYAFDYGGVNPWAWQADDGSMEYAEPFDGGYRYYYYEPGAYTPYLIRDPEYSYAFDGPALVVIYDDLGRIVPPSDYGPRHDFAGRYFARSRELRVAAQTDHHAVVAGNWAAQRYQIAVASSRWDAARAQNPAWSAYHDSTRDEQRAHWQGEHNSRAQAASLFNNYQRQGMRGQPPSLAQNSPPATVAAPGREPVPGSGVRERQPYAVGSSQAEQQAQQQRQNQALQAQLQTVRNAERQRQQQQSAQREAAHQQQVEAQRQQEATRQANAQAERQQARQQREDQARQAQAERAQEANRQRQQEAARQANAQAERQAREQAQRQQEAAQQSQHAERENAVRQQQLQQQLQHQQQRAEAPQPAKPPAGQGQGQAQHDKGNDHRERPDQH
jgi:hypothetical protein